MSDNRPPNFFSTFLFVIVLSVALIVIGVGLIISNLVGCVRNGEIDETNPLSVMVKSSIENVIGNVTKDVAEDAEQRLQDTIAEQSDQVQQNTSNRVQGQLNQLAEESDLVQAGANAFNQDTRNEEEPTASETPSETPSETAVNTIVNSNASRTPVGQVTNANSIQNQVTNQNVLNRLAFDTREGFNSVEGKSTLPTTGSEPQFNKHEWNDPNFIKTNNCYAYFLNDKKYRDKKPQPGYFSGNETQNTYSSCAETESRVLQDNPHIYMANETQPCKTGYYKGFLAIDQGKDYHFYRQDANGFWSHKPGALEVTNLDSNGNLITNPREASKIYDNFQYTTNCNYFCVPENGHKPTNAK